MLRGIYSFAILIYLMLIRLHSLFSRKSRAWISGRKTLWDQLHTIPVGRRVVWIHCASLGEFEQARSVIDQLRNNYPEHYLLLTFFSPSGYEIRKNYPYVDLVTYLPIDLPTQVHRFVRLVKPEVAIFVKYEFWFNIIKACHDFGATLLLISGVFRSTQHFFKRSGAWQRRHLKMFDHYFVQDRASADLLSSIGLNNVTVSGDTRFDRVIDLPNISLPDNLRFLFNPDDFVIVAGSTYEPDETLLFALLKRNPDLKLIIAPHQVTDSRVTSLVKRFAEISNVSKASRYSGTECQVIIIDSIGHLSLLYRLGNLAYIGGGFGKGIHNTLEAATYGIPICFGPAWRKFNEAHALIELGAAHEIRNNSDLENWFSMLRTNPVLINTLGESARDYVVGQAGATQSIISYLEQVFEPPKLSQ